MAALLLLCFALVFAVIAALFEPFARPWGRVHWGWLAVACFIGSLLVGKF